MVSPSSRYSSESHFALERRELFRERPVYIGLGCEIATAGANHAWTYGLDGALRSRPRSDGAFDDVTIDCDLHAVSVGERHGILFVASTVGLLMWMPRSRVPRMTSRRSSLPATRTWSPVRRCGR